MNESYHCLKCEKSTSMRCSEHSSFTYIIGEPVWERKPYKCPVCDGTGKVSRPPWLAGDITEWTDSQTTPYPCQACNAKGIVWG